MVNVLKKALLDYTCEDSSCPAATAICYVPCAQPEHCCVSGRKQKKQHCMLKSTKHIILMQPIQWLPGCYGSRYGDLHFNSSSSHGASSHRAHTQVARRASEGSWLFFWNPFLPKAAALCAKHNSTGDALNSSEISAAPTYGASRHTTYKTNL